MYGHAAALLRPCTRPGCTTYATALDDEDRLICAPHAIADLIGAP